MTLRLRLHAALLILALVLSTDAAAQNVDTALAGYNCNGDIAVDSQGNLYFAGDGILRRMTPAGDIETLAAGFPVVRGMDFSSDDILYVGMRNTGQVRKVATDGSWTLLASGMALPTGITAASNGVVYASDNYGVHRIDPDGTRTVVTTDPSLNRPHGITTDPEGRIYVSSAHDGNIFRITEGEGGASIELFAHVDGLNQAWACGYMAYLDGYLYITNGDNKVHAVNMAGEVSDYAGNGNWGYVDGPAAQAEFMAPAGISELNDGTLFVAEFNHSRTRRITPDPTAAPQAPGGRLELGQNHPNPFNPSTEIHFELGSAGSAQLSIHDTRGRRVRTLLDGRLAEGAHRVSWDGKDEGGVEQAAGLYFYRLAGEAEVHTRKMLMLK